MSQPFSRASHIGSLIAAALAMGGDLGRSQLALIPEYRSRGKGKAAAHHSRCNRRVQRAATKARNVARNRRAHK